MGVRTIISTKFILGLVLAALVLAPAAAFSWEAATHAYIEANLYKRQGLTDETMLSNRIYGANTIDLFNFDFQPLPQTFVTYLHDPGQENFLKVWNSAGNETERAFAYGFVGHNNTWGMDSTAHISGISFGRGEGYVIAKARLLAGMLKPVLESPDVGLVLPDDVLLKICHQFVESGVDLLVKSLDPTVGSRLIAASYYRSDQVPSILVNAYAGDLGALAGSSEKAADMIVKAEGALRMRLMGYGWALTQDNALDIISGEMGKLGEQMLGLQPGAGEALAPIAKQGIIAAMSLCAPDFEGELRATTGWVNGNLSSAGVSW